MVLGSILPVGKGVFADRNVEAIVWSERRLYKRTLAYPSYQFLKQAEPDVTNSIRRDSLGVNIIVVIGQASSTMATFNQHLVEWVVTACWLCEP